jgi:hypothetical protein
MTEFCSQVLHEDIQNVLDRSSCYAGARDRTQNALERSSCYGVDT